MARIRARNPVRRIQVALSKQHSHILKGHYYRRQHQAIDVVTGEPPADANNNNYHGATTEAVGDDDDNDNMDFSVGDDQGSGRCGDESMQNDGTSVIVALTSLRNGEEEEEEPKGAEDIASEIVNLEVDDRLFVEQLLNDAVVTPPPPHETLPYNNVGATSSHYNILTYRVMTEFYLLGMKRGASIDFMNEIVSLFRKAAKEGFDMRTAPLRGTFLKHVRQHMGDSAPPIPKSVMVSRSGPWLPKFSLAEQIQDLLASSEFQCFDNLVVNRDPDTRFHKYVVPEGEQLLEVNSGRWYSETYDKLGIDPTKDWLFPLIFYIDKTGTDAMQRFPLEPLMFTTTVLKRSVREQASAWRHLGFIPTCDDEVGGSPRQSMQLFHQCLSVLLQDLVTLQATPPTFEFSIDGVVVSRRLILPVAFVMGDQLSQDKHCGRKAVNGGGAGKVHRRCMTSSMMASSTEHPCKSVSKHHLDNIRALALNKDEINVAVGQILPPLATKKQKQCLRLYLTRRSRFARSVLEKVYSMYPIKNAWSEINFGANNEGIFRASMDDPMHYCDSGTFLYLAQVVFLSMTESERATMERIIRSYFQGKRSSVRDDLPRGKFTAGFTRTTLLTAGEKIGLILSLLVCLGSEQGAEVFTKVLARVQQKYETVPTPEEEACPRRGDVHFFADLKHSNQQKGKGGAKRTKRMDRSLPGIRKMVKSVVRHDLGFMLSSDCHELDELQTEYFLQAVNSILEEPNGIRSLTYPDTLIPGLYRLPHNNFELSAAHHAQALHLHSRVRKSVPLSSTGTCSTPCLFTDEKEQEDEDDEDDLEEEDGIPTSGGGSTTSVGIEVKEHIPKHGLARPKVKGNGETSAILTDLPGFRRLLTKALSFHSFIHYFEEVSPEQRVDVDGIRHSLCEYVKEYCRCVYRGDDSTDCDTCKVHCHLHLDTDILDYGHPMNWEAGKGERGLKVWAKLASTTAQKQSLSVFTYQTALRVAEASLLTKLLTTILANSKKNTNRRGALLVNSGGATTTKRKEPHFLLNLRDGTIKKNSRHGETNDLQVKLIHGKVLHCVRRHEGRTGTIKIWKETLLRTEEERELRVRACSQYDRFGDFFDWVSVQSDAEDPSSCYPAKILMIYEDNSQTLCAIVHACEWRNEKERSAATALTQRWSLEYADGKIVLRKIRFADVVEVIYCIEHTGEKKGSMGLNVPLRDNSRRKYAVDIVEPRYAWAQEFISSKQ